MMYEPQPGTSAHRAIQHLKSLGDGAPPSTAQLAEILGVESKLVQAYLASALKHGLIYREKSVETGLLHWRLGRQKHADPEPEEPLHDVHVVCEAPPKSARSVFDMAASEAPEHGSDADASFREEHGEISEEAQAHPLHDDLNLVSSPFASPTEAIDGDYAPCGPIPVGDATELPEDTSVPPPRFALWSDGRFEIQLCSGCGISMNRSEFAAMVRHLDGQWLDAYREVA